MAPRLQDHFEDAYDRIPAACQMDLRSAIQETQCALNLVLNNKFSEALDLLKPWWRDSMYHALGYSSILVMQAAMTFEHRDIQIAMATIKEALRTCQRFRKKNSVVGSLSSLLSRQRNLQEEEMHAELCYAECLLQKATLTFVQDENMISFIKGGIKIRSSYQIYKDCHNVLNVARELSSQSDSHRQFEGGVKLGIGSFNLMVSLLPQRILRLLEFMGFSGNREFGLSQLREGTTGSSLRSILCTLTLLFYHTYVSLVLGSGEGSVAEAEALLEPYLHKYPKGAIIQFYSARLAALRGNLEKACLGYRECVNGQQEWKQIHHLCYWELMWTHSYRQDWPQAYGYAELLCRESRWSKAIYVYQKAAILSMMSAEDVKKTGEDVVALFRCAPAPLESGGAQAAAGGKVHPHREVRGQEISPLQGPRARAAGASRSGNDVHLERLHHRGQARRLHRSAAGYHRGGRGATSPRFPAVRVPRGRRLPGADAEGSLPETRRAPAASRALLHARPVQRKPHPLRSLPGPLHALRAGPPLPSAGRRRQGRRLHGKRQEIASSPSRSDDFLGPEECLLKKPTRASCDLVFCPPWQRCIEGRCSCKPPYLCPAEGSAPVCAKDGYRYSSYCQVMAMSCRFQRSTMSHFGETCSDQRPKFNITLDPDTGALTLFVPDGASPEGGKHLLVCGERWNMESANAVCRGLHHPLGAASAGLLEATALRRGFPDSCVSLRCQGFETSPAECVIHDAVRVGDGKVATATCYRESDATEERGFACASGKRVPADRTCDGTDDCGDQSDEMCCKRCRGGAFRCDTGVCLHPDAEGDGQIDCLAGEDEAATRKAAGTESKSTEYVSPRKEILTDRLHLESRLRCGVPNATAAYDDSVKDRARRFRRVVGGVAANRTQIQWQVGLSENGKVNCGGTYIGGCWIVTAAHCVRPHPSAYRVKFSIWEKSRPQDTTDIIPVGEVIIHPGFDSRTYENDIALVRLKDLPEQWGKCMEDNPAVKPACVPWSERLFNANHTCSISGWGRTAVGKASQVLLWAKVSLIDDCRRFYKDRFKPGMMCAGDLEGAVDSCQGDSGGPLVCEDHLGVSYLWGIVSWGDQCGQPGFPGVYTQVAHYFEWIRLHTGWSAVTRFNS
ncbi:uncharacterized protein LOC133494677 isoform X2 [Syngnathoides biaculeatus]|uniref:uncharacterized protein LOC133494677 isoform X2 n=1 Tax=Syngnathoides biaculeatus TaxID=300417 RepID=UPI002ADE013C|nr:uncharacterized protein LOC133494677 isoform X2 [Syngnathoides biaculeatus]XP_061664692.1 uncharacterized protein LOC133494677 isoform X2 [Syngnathoides biaculeatus]XP_061664693.1 uncharacterized protein LOC133494677 isoform X2 [Syngnathoides biaculeatus]